MRVKRPIAAALVTCACLSVQAQNAPATTIAGLSVTNNLNELRVEEVLELRVADVLNHVHGAALESLIVRDPARNKILPTQLYRSAGAGSAPDKCLVLVSLASKQSLQLELESSPAAALSKPLVKGGWVPERKDDFSWENDKIGYRMYGPALQATGEISSGVDVWLKKVPDLVVDNWYRRDAEAARRGDHSYSYHKDYGQGLDSYRVGPRSMGAGGTAIWYGDQLIFSKNYATWKLIADGPIRVSFELSYAPWQAAGTTVSEVKRITLDAGSHLNRMESTFAFESGRDLPVAAGVAVHAGGQVEIAPDKAYISEWEAADDKTAGMVATGILLPWSEKAEPTNTSGHAFYVFNMHSGKPITYYAGAGWSKSDVPDQMAWNRYLAGFAARLQSPLEVRWK